MILPHIIRPDIASHNLFELNSCIQFTVIMCKLLSRAAGRGAGVWALISVYIVTFPDYHVTRMLCAALCHVTVMWLPL